jgi:2,3,4,5-tetrahydropyridine-2,6-dicarboxylate N-succinyltransferase
VARQYLGEAGHLLGFRFGDIVDQSAGLPFYDKDTQTVQRFDPASNIRIVPGGSAVRGGAHLARGVICVPPMYINIGAYVGEGSLVDSHALIGSCAQIGARVHVSAAAQIGGVLEPVGAMPVIVEDDVLVGGNTGIYEGAVIKQRAVIAAGTVLTGSTPVYDLVNSTIIKPAAGQPLVIPAGAVVVPGARAVTVGAGKEWGTLARHAGDREVSRRQDGLAHGARKVDQVDPLALARQLIDIESTTGMKVGSESGSRIFFASADTLFLNSHSMVRESMSLPLSVSRRSSSRPISIAFLPFFQAALTTASSMAAAPAMPKASSPRRWPPRNGCARKARRASDWCSSAAKSAAAMARRPPIASPRSRAS